MIVSLKKIWKTHWDLYCNRKRNDRRRRDCSGIDVSAVGVDVGVTLPKHQSMIDRASVSLSLSPYIDCNLNEESLSPRKSKCQEDTVVMLESIISTPSLPSNQGDRSPGEKNDPLNDVTVNNESSESNSHQESKNNSLVAMMNVDHVDRQNNNIQLDHVNHLLTILPLDDINCNELMSSDVDDEKNRDIISSIDSPLLESTESTRMKKNSFEPTIVRTTVSCEQLCDHLTSNWVHTKLSSVDERNRSSSCSSNNNNNNHDDDNDSISRDQVKKSQVDLCDTWLPMCKVCQLIPCEADVVSEQHSKNTKDKDKLRRISSSFSLTEESSLINGCVSSCYLFFLHYYYFSLSLLVIVA